MKRTILICFLLAGGIADTYAQDAQPAEPAAKTRKYEHQVGVQMNQLVRQIFNFSNSSAGSTTSTNPFLLTYTLTNIKSGWGLRLGGGYNQDGFKENDGVTNRDTRIKDINARIGVEKSFTLSKRWSAGVGLDAVYANNTDETDNIVSSTTPLTFSTTNTTKNFGGGAMAWLRYHINKNVLIGTETSFYYRTGTVESGLSVNDPLGGLGGGFFPGSTTSTQRSEGVFSVPSVLYLIVKF